MSSPLHRGVRGGRHRNALLLDEVTRLEDESAEAKRVGAWLYDHVSQGTGIVLGDVSDWPWLLDRD